MRRRDFIKKGLRSSGVILAAPYILPSGRLFAATGERKVNHVVFCLFAGGIRNMESIHKAEGNLMPFTLRGNEAISTDISDGFEDLPNSSNHQPLQNFGTLFKEFRYDNFQTNHYNGYVTAITGRYSPYAEMMQHPKRPTVFEYYRKHNAAKASSLKSWWICDQPGPFPFINHSNHALYGGKYGANTIVPKHMVSKQNRLFNSSLTQNQVKQVKEIRQFLNAHSEYFPENQDLFAVESENAFEVQDFLIELARPFKNANVNPVANAFDIDGELVNSDFLNMYTAIKVLEKFHPELLVVDMVESDIGHFSFTDYCNNLRKADYALSKLWAKIQSIPEMRDDTILIAVPEFGRNLEPNTMRDHYGRLAIDHTGDDTSKEIFCLILGPESVVRQNQVISEVHGQSIDVVPTIANILGFDQNIPEGMLKGEVLKQAFV